MQTFDQTRLRDLVIRESYDSGELGTQLASDFFEPCLGLASSYLRIAGYFNSGMLAACARGMAGFIRGNGEMKLICSPHLSEFDIARLDSSNGDGQATAKVFDEALVRGMTQIDELEDLIERNHVEAMAWMISRERLEIRIAIPKDPRNADQLFHQKRGIIEDRTGDRLSFSGSINETHAGWSRNVEEFKVFRSWVAGQDGFVQSDRQAFLSYWSGSSTHTHTAISLPEAFKKRLIKHAPKDVSSIDLKIPKREIDLNAGEESPKLRPLRAYQEAALTAWNLSGQQGILQMATGAGKTATAAHCIEEFFSRNNNRGFVVVTAPYQHIASQWLVELAHHTPLAPWKESNWRKSLSELAREMRAGFRHKAVVVTVQNTAATDDFLKNIEHVAQTFPTMIVGDEAHALGASAMSKSLSDFYVARLGLTATPSRYYDEDGSDNLLKYFGGTVYEFSLEDALHTTDEHGRTILCPYEYQPVFFNLLESELEKYQSLTTDIIRLSGKTDSTSREKLRKRLLARARVVKSSEGKLPEFRRIIRNLSDRSRLVVYCDNLTQMEASAEILADFGVKYARFSGLESVKPDPLLGGKSERETILQNFTDGKIDALVAMKCLDEGVNIPTAEIAILLASSGNPKEFIQRRGRMMRQSPQTGKLRAVIYDLVAIPSSGTPHSVPASDEVKIMQKELSRVSEFACSALNASTVEYELFELRSSLGISGESGGNDG